MERRSTRIVAALLLGFLAVGLAFAFVSCASVGGEPPPVLPPPPGGGGGTVEPPPPPPPPPPAADVAALLARITVGMTVDQATAVVGVPVKDRPPSMARWLVTIGTSRYLVFVNLDAGGRVTARDASLVETIR